MTFILFLFKVSLKVQMSFLAQRKHFFLCKFPEFINKTVANSMQEISLDALKRLISFS